MNRGLLTKALREVWFGTLLFGMALFLIEFVFSIVLPRYMEQFTSQLNQIPFFRTIVKALIGVDVGEQIGPLAFISIAWVHPVPLALMWAHEIIFCTRTPVGEIDRGTIDVVLSLPVSRWQTYITETVVWLGTGVVIISLALVGNLCGTWTLPVDRRPEFFDLIRVVANLFAVYLAVGGIAYLVSSFSDRRGRAVGAIFGVVLASFFMSFIVQFSESAQGFSFLSLLHYYRPFEIIQSNGWPLGDIAALASVGFVGWLLGGIIFSRRDICTV